MAVVHLTKFAFGCRDLDVLRERQHLRLEDGYVPHITRYKPKRAAEILEGGSLFWIFRHTLVARQAILGFGEAETEKGVRCLIKLDPELKLVQPRPLRAHQGWRYLEAADAPDDLGDGNPEIVEMPARMLRELAALGLV